MKPCSSETIALDIPEASHTLQNIRCINFPVYTMYGMLLSCKLFMHSKAHSIDKEESNVGKIKESTWRSRKIVFRTTVS